jgi:hypothetical protein
MGTLQYLAEVAWTPGTAVSTNKQGVSKKKKEKDRPAKQELQTTRPSPPTFKRCNVMAEK